MILIGICGKARSGKDTAADHLVNNYNLRKYSMAYPIRRMLGEIGVFYMNSTDKESPHYMFKKSPREMMQTLGTEWGRNLVDTDIWLKLAKDNLTLLQDMVVPDVRFQNEADWIRAEGTLLHVSRPDCPVIAKHSSEDGIEVDLMAGDLIVENDSNFKILYEQLDMVMGLINAKETTLST